MTKKVVVVPTERDTDKIVCCKVTNYKNFFGYINRMELSLYIFTLALFKQFIIM